ncbi:NAD(P)-dependent alcohol dehydrogenase [Chengkuizengella marina]|uniref:NAD(P)-dependent alcohol dehydrogenase n=1 Tax=Chengkuizengella marina TaxID=2507566 RepID=A0A6N9Q623_9BACL|nr:NAD(P)-dependent alcohol dehydrogenase [Chengkuizengella marina]NBI30220.1 NAD(P)-dependent alcohol dehydrogenase [Chengkuizengella marina]
MKGIICTKYGPPEVLQLNEVEKPIPKNNEVLIKIHETAVTASDCVIRGFKMPGNPSFPKKQVMELMMRLFIGFSKPRNPIIGLVFSGVVESVGKDIKQFKEGDQVYGFTGNSRGAYAEYKCVSAKEAAQGELVIKPNNISHKEAAAVVYGGALAMHFMKDMDIQRSGQKVLIYGASGAIGTTAVQLAKYFGAEVTAICSSSNFELVRSLGADKVIDYTKEDSINQLELYDFILDAVGKSKSSTLKIQCKKALRNGKYVSVDDKLLKIQSHYLPKLNELIEAGHVKAVIDRNYSLAEIVEAHKYVDTGHKKGNVVITV